MATKKPKDETTKPRRLRVHVDLYDNDNSPLVKAGATISESKLNPATVKWLLKDDKAEVVEDK